MDPCPLCPRAEGRIIIPGSGPMPCRLMGIGESPAGDENKRGVAWIGRTGKELNNLYLPIGGLRRDPFGESDIRMSNSIRCWPRSDRDLSDEILESCAGCHLRPEIYACKPEIIIPLGARACRLAGIDVEMDHGFAMESEILGYRAWMFPQFHPALGMHDYAMMQNLMDDWDRFRRWQLGEDMSAPVDQHPNPHYRRLRTPEEVTTVFTSKPPWCGEPLAIDTEYEPLVVGKRPYCLTFSHTPGEGYLIKAEDRAAVQEFSRLVVGTQRQGGILQFKGYPLPPRNLANERDAGGWRGPIIMHNAPADLPVLDDMGIPIDQHQVKDTMQLAYHLCSMPQGLKTLAYRLCGMKMKEFSDLVTPYAIEYQLAYMEILSQEDWGKPEPYMRLTPEKQIEEIDGVPVTVGTQMVEKLYKPQGLSTKIKRLLTDFTKNPSHKVFKRWDTWDDIEKAPAIAKHGGFPEGSITQVSNEDDLLNYAVADADGTLRVYHKLMLLSNSFRRRYNV